MALSKFETIPVECRALVFKYLFQRTDVWLLDPLGRLFEAVPGNDEHLPILLVSKLIYAEARPILAASVKFYVLAEGDTDFLHPRLRAFYFPLIRHVVISHHIPDSFNIGEFSSMKRLKIISDDDTGIPPVNGIHDYYLPAVGDVQLARKIMLGALDHKLKASSRDILVRRQPWIANILTDPNRSYEVISHLGAIWDLCFEIQVADQGEISDLKFDLGDLRTMKRSILTLAGEPGEYGSEVKTTWKKGRMKGFRPFTREEVDEPWDYEAYQAMSEDRDMVDLRPEVNYDEWEALFHAHEDDSASEASDDSANDTSTYSDPDSVDADSLREDSDAEHEQNGDYETLSDYSSGSDGNDEQGRDYFDDYSESDDLDGD